MVAPLAPQPGEPFLELNDLVQGPEFGINLNQLVLEEDLGALMI